MAASQPDIQMAVPTEEVADICRRYPIKEMALFGSVLRPDFTDRSDVDVLVDVKPDQLFGLLDMGGLVMDLQDLFGRSVDLAVMRTLKPYLRQEILSSRQVLYVAKD